LSSHIILVGNSTPEVVDPLRLRLSQLGYTVDVTSNPAEALTLASGTAPAAILVDISVPEVKGIETCSFLRHTLNTPIIALNHGEPKLRQAALDAGADAVFNYPIHWDEIHQLLLSSPGVQDNGLAGGGLFGGNRQDISGSTALLSHDLKSPIGVIVSSLEVLITTYENDDSMSSTLRLLRGALNAAYRQMYMVSDLIDLARLEIDDYDLRKEDVDIVQVVCDGLDTEAYALSTKKLQLELDLPEHPLPAAVDVLLMNRVMSAMVDNVIKFTVRDDRLTVKAWQEDDKIVIMFTDNGRPIQAGFEEFILQRAPQWEGRQNGTRTSVGMGLPFIRAVAKAHGGTFTAHTDPESKLTRFTLTLPASK
jgi:two-component system, sensor histidine kinase